MKPALLGGAPAAAARAGVPSAAAPLRLRAADVDLWRASLDEQPAELVTFLAGLLSAEERTRAENFFFERDRRRFTVGRGLLRLLLGRYLELPPERILFRYGPNGKPELAPREESPAAPRRRSNLHFNLAHSEGLALFAFTPAAPVGVDLEQIRDLPDWEQIAATCFTGSERARVDAVAPELRPIEFFRAWTRQEARLKATGQGLGGAAAPAGRPAGGFTDGLNPAFSLPAFAPHRVYALQVASGYAAALAVTPDVRWATCLTWDHLQWSGRNRTPRRGRRIPLANPALTGIGFL